MNKKNLLDRSYLASLLISSVIIILVQLSSLFIITMFRAKDVNRKAVLAADELKVFLAEPMYNLNDDQVLKIAEFLLSSGRVSGIRIYSSASGIIIDKLDSGESFWVKPQFRSVESRGVYLGEISVQYSDSDFIEVNKIVFLMTFALLAGVLSANYLGFNILIRNRIRKTFLSLTEGLNKIESGYDEYSIRSSGYADFDQIIDAMNAMSNRLRAKNLELQEVNSMLEQRVAERTSELETSLTELHLTQDRLIESSKLSVLGQLAAGIAHEFNTPLGAIISSVGILTDFFDNSLEALSAFQQSMNPAEKALFMKVTELGIQKDNILNIPLFSMKNKRKTYGELKTAGIPNYGILAESLTELGVSAGIQELIPLLSVARNIQVVAEASRPVIARRMIEVINESGRKAADVISAFRSYLSPESGRNDQIINVDEDFKKILILMHNLLKMGITVETSFSQVHVRGSSDKLSQVWMNFIRNAAQSMNYTGELLLKTEKKDGSAFISVIDSGPGIPEDIKDQIFEPFFTTRQKGEGMGLGLNICKRIIESHNGTIVVNSRPGRTEFTVILPLEEV